MYNRKLSPSITSFCYLGSWVTQYSAIFGSFISFIAWIALNGGAPKFFIFAPITCSLLVFLPALKEL